MFISYPTVLRALIHREKKLKAEEEEARVDPDIDPLLFFFHMFIPLQQLRETCEIRLELRYRDVFYFFSSLRVKLIARNEIKPLMAR